MTSNSLSDSPSLRPEVPFRKGKVRQRSASSAEGSPPGDVGAGVSKKKNTRGSPAEIIGEEEILRILEFDSEGEEYKGDNTGSVTSNEDYSP